MPRKDSNNWYVITGGPSTGKTTIIEELSRRGHTTFPEAARTVIDEALKNGISVEQLRSDEKKFQDQVTKLKQQIEASHNTDTLTFFDRGMHDTLAYFRHYDFPVDDWTNRLLDKSRYKKVFLLEPISKYKKDYARVENEHFRNNITQLLHDAYTEYGMQPIIVPAIGLENRIKFILDAVKSDK
jgi:predicted ATPase